MKPKSLSKERFGKFAQGYVESITHSKLSELNRLVEIVQPRKNWRVLDVATGGGHTALRFSSEVAEVYSVDLTPNMLKKAEAFIKDSGALNVSFKEGDAENLPFEDKSFDLVTCRVAPHHFPDCPRFVKEAFRVLKAGCILIVQDHLLPSDLAAARVVDEFEKLRDPSHNRAYNDSEWTDMFESAGFSIEHTEVILKTHAFLPWAERQECSPETVEALITMLEEGSDSVIDWMRPNQWRSDKATFVNHHIIITGRK